MHLDFPPTFRYIDGASSATWCPTPIGIIAADAG
jgi:hypothetical protein